MIVLIGGEKGGTGKTTLATNLAAMRSQAGMDVLLVDTDRQGSSGYWASVRSEDDALTRVPCVQVFGKSLARELRDLSARYDDLIVDAGGRDSVELRSAMVAADRLYVPVQASQFDVWTLEQMDGLVSQAQAINPSLEAAVVINRASTHPRVREADEASTIVADYEALSFTGLVVRDRISYRRAASAGRSVVESADPDVKAIREMKAWYAAVYGAEV